MLLTWDPDQITNENFVMAVAVPKSIHPIEINHAIRALVEVGEQVLKKNNCDCAGCKMMETQLSVIKSILED